MKNKNHRSYLLFLASLLALTPATFAQENTAKHYQGDFTLDYQGAPKGVFHADFWIEGTPSELTSEPVTEAKTVPGYEEALDGHGPFVNYETRFGFKSGMIRVQITNMETHAIVKSFSTPLTFTALGDAYSFSAKADPISFYLNHRIDFNFSFETGNISLDNVKTEHNNFAKNPNSLVKLDVPHSINPAGRVGTHRQFSIFGSEEEYQNHLKLELQTPDYSQ